MKRGKSKNVLGLLNEIEADLRSSSDILWIKRLKEKVKQKLRHLKKLTKKEALDELRDNLVKLDKSVHEDEVFINKLRTKINGTRKRKAS